MLTERYNINGPTQKSFVSQMKVPIDAKVEIEEFTIESVVFNDVAYSDVVVKYEKLLNYTGIKKRPHVSKNSVVQDV